MPTIILGIFLGLLILYFIFTAPRMFKRADRKPFMGFWYAHRGFHDNKTDAPENSLPAFRHAVEKGYGIELDVQLTKDEKAVVFHDNDLKRVCGIDKPVNYYTYDELREFTLFDTNERIPLFTDVLAVIDKKVPVIVEIKMVDSATRVCELANAILLKYEGLYCIESFHPYAVKWFKEHRPELLRGQLSDNFAKESGRESFGMFMVHFLLSNFATRPDFIAYSCDSPDNMSFMFNKLLGALPIAWTVKSPEKLKAVRNKYRLFIFEGFEPEKADAGVR